VGVKASPTFYVTMPINTLGVAYFISEICTFSRNQGNAFTGMPEIAHQRPFPDGMYLLIRHVCPAARELKLSIKTIHNERGVQTKDQEFSRPGTHRCIGVFPK
jgi:citrate synthase